MSTTSTLMTTEELLAMPDDGVDRWLINGELREQCAMTRRNRIHSLIMASVATELKNWSRESTEPRGQVLAGDAGVRISNDPDTTFGIDVVYVSADVLEQQSDATTIIEGAPTLAVEILSPSDTIENINEKLESLLAAGTPLVWIIEPRQRTVMAYRPNTEPALFTVEREITAEPQLPGFAAPVLRFFE